MKDMKQLIVIVGPNGVGKSTTAMHFTETCRHTAMVDSDWCRAMNPFPLTDATKETVIDNMYCMLRNYLCCDEIHTVVFVHSWHGGRKELYDTVIARLRDDGICFQEQVIILKCSESENRRRAFADHRDAERIERGIRNTYSFYNALEYPCINTTHMTIEEVAESIRAYIEERN